MFNFVVVLNPLHILRVLFWTTVPLSILIIGIALYNNYDTKSELRNAKPYKLNTDPKTGYPVINISKIKVGEYDFQSPSFFVSTKNGVFLMTGGFWAKVRYQNIVEDMSSEQTIKGAKKFKVQVEEFNAYIPESCKNPITQNLNSRRNLISKWMAEKKGTSYVYLEGVNQDIPKIENILTVCPTYFSMTKYPIDLFSDYVQYCSDDPSCSSTVPNPPDFLGVEKNWCLITQGAETWSGEGCATTNVFLESLPAKKGEFHYLNNKDQAELLNNQFSDYLTSLAK